jgi:hypothetical protein
MASNIIHFQSTDCHTNRAVVMAATLRSGAGSHKSGPRGGQRNFVRDILDEYYAESNSDNEDSTSQSS